MARIRGTMFHSPDGIPVDLFDHLLSHCQLQTGEDMEQMIQLRCQEEDVCIIANATSVLTLTATSTTLRYSLHLISCTWILAWKRKAEQVGVEDPQRAYMYFVDEKRIIQELKKQQRSLHNSLSCSHLRQ
ncbi:hypothetical protein EDD85DRAFT_857888 [Armillaria nabsnona]|nr:hypothetical protein EDD85DRAFT_872568 [Armillaria nabsnona]KAK0224547.1 hypothetical protein EDD85DRAFT_857888 [Armillaria nabsnona]